MPLKLLDKIIKKALSTNAWNTDKSVGITLKARLLFDDKSKSKKVNEKTRMSKPIVKNREITEKEVY